MEAVCLALGPKDVNSIGYISLTLSLLPHNLPPFLFFFLLPFFFSYFHSKVEVGVAAVHL